MIQIAIDIGGTFTDVVAIEGGRQVFVTKVPSTPTRLVAGVRQGVEKILKLAGAPPADVDRFIHGTTVATNAVLERKGAVTAVFTTEGFEDVLELGRLKRSKMYDIFMDAETPIFLAPRRRRYGIKERVGSRGQVLTPLEEEQVRQVTLEAVELQKVEAIAVCYLFSFLNPAHEQRTREIVRQVAPHVRVSLSSELLPVFREYERTVVTGFDAYVRPVIEDYLGALQAELEAVGLQVNVQVMQSRGGIAAADNALDKPVTMLLSGPAGGVAGGKHEGERSGFENLITLDMGGTSCDVAIVQEGRPLITTEAKIDRYPLTIPMVDVSTIGSGGGSIAWLDPAGGLRVGPRSAGADPGPACYGRGGTNATVTDASVVLGYLNPDYFAAGDLRLDPRLAEAAVGAVADRLGMELHQAALGIHRVVNALMSDQLRLMSVKRGHDPRHFALVLLGGAGPVHGALLASELGIPTTIVPESPGVLSAFGLLVAHIEHDHMRTFVARTDQADVHRMQAIYADLDVLGREKMSRERVEPDRVEVLRSADMRYVGQSYELEVPLAGEIDSNTPTLMVRQFHATHERVYGHSSPDDPVEFVNLRTVHVYSLPRPNLAPRAVAGGLDQARKGVRRAFFAESPNGVDTPIYERGLLPVGTRLAGPAIVEQPDTTTVVYPGHVCLVDPVGNLLITRASSPNGVNGTIAAARTGGY